MFSSENFPAASVSAVYLRESLDSVTRARTTGSPVSELVTTPPSREFCATHAKAADSVQQSSRRSLLPDIDFHQRQFPRDFFARLDFDLRHFRHDGLEIVNEAIIRVGDGKQFIFAGSNPVNRVLPVGCYIDLVLTMNRLLVSYQKNARVGIPEAIAIGSFDGSGNLSAIGTDGDLQLRAAHAARKIEHSLDDRTVEADLPYVGVAGKGFDLNPIAARKYIGDAERAIFPHVTGGL